MIAQRLFYALRHYRIQFVRASSASDGANRLAHMERKGIWLTVKYVGPRLKAERNSAENAARPYPPAIRRRLTRAPQLARQHNPQMAHPRNLRRQHNPQRPRNLHPRLLRLPLMRRLRQRVFRNQIYRHRLLRKAERKVGDDPQPQRRRQHHHAAEGRQ